MVIFMNVLEHCIISCIGIVKYVIASLAFKFSRVSFLSYIISIYDFITIRNKEGASLSHHDNWDSHLG